MAVMYRQSHTLVLAAVFAISACLLAPSAHAGRYLNAYLGVDGSSFSLANTTDDNLNPKGLRLRLGFRLNRVFDLEGHFGFGSDSDNTAFDEIGTVYSSAFLKAHAPLGVRSNAYAMAGFSALEITETVGRQEFSDDDVSFSFGFGLETALTDRLDLSADFVRYSQQVGGFEDLSAVSLGLKLYF